MSKSSEDTDPRGDIPDFVEERNATLRSMDEQRIRDFAAKWDMPVPDEEEIFWAGIHQARTAIRLIPDAERALSRKWLRLHGFESWGDEMDEEDEEGGARP